MPFAFLFGLCVILRILMPSIRPLIKELQWDCQQRFLVFGGCQEESNGVREVCRG